MCILTLTSHSSDETQELGRQLGLVLKRGMFVALRGDLGGGKTCFSRGIVAAVAPASAHLVSSPTFAIMNEYPGDPPVYHFDFYRLTSGHEISELGFEEIFHGDGLCIAEWSERLGNLLPPDHLRVTFTHAGEEQRMITFEAVGLGPEAVLAGFRTLREA